MIWSITHEVGDAASLHALGPGEGRSLRWCEATAPAVVLGSTQPLEHVAAGWPVVRRRSGGSAVVVGPGRLVWADVTVPVGDVLWHDDVGIAPVWLGRVWASALSSLGVAAAVVHEGAMVRAPWSERVCFAGLGPGEVTVEGRKVVGISQRRTRAVAFFQSAALLTWSAGETAEALQVVEGALDDVAVGVDTLVGPASPASVAAAFEAALAAAG